MGIDERILLSVLHFTICAYLLCSILLWMRRDVNDKSRRYLAITSLISGLAFLGRLLITKTGMPPTPEVLPIANLYAGLLALLLFYMYPIEVISPGWLTWKRKILLFLPWILLTFILLLFPLSFRELSSFEEVWQYISEFNVWFRLLILMIIIAPYSFMLFYIPHNWMKSSVSNKWIYFILVVTYQEIFLRIEVPVRSQVTNTEFTAIPDHTIQEEESATHPLLIRLNELMDREELWRNPDINLIDLASLLHTNRTTLTQLIQEEGYKGYKDFINRRRIDEFLKIADSGKLINVQDTFFEVGFRSKMTALRYFREYTGTIPTDYIRKTTE